MKTKGPKSIVSRPQNSSSGQSTAPSSVGSAYNQSLQRQLDHSAQLRKRLKAAEYSAQGEVKSNLKKRGDMVERRIANLQSKINKRD